MGVIWGRYRRELGCYHQPSPSPSPSPGTPLVALVEFDDGGAAQSFKQPAWATLTLVRAEGAPANTARGLSRGLRLEHPKHGLGVLQSLQVLPG